MAGGTPLLLVNPKVALSTGDVFAAWDGIARGPLDDWREGRNDLEAPARSLGPAIGEMLDWLGFCAFNGLAHAEGRGAFSGKLGERVVAPSVNISDSPRFPRTPASPLRQRFWFA